MDAKRLLRGPLFWVLIFVFAAIVLTRMLDSSGGFERVDRPRGQFFHTNWTGRGGTTSASTYSV